MAADGNCLFRALSHGLSDDFGSGHALVRSDLCVYLLRNGTDFKEFLLPCDDDSQSVDVCNPADYVAKMGDDGEWGGDVEIVCAARRYRRRITVFSSEGAYHVDPDDNVEGSDLLLSYHENNHYNAVTGKGVDEYVRSRVVDSGKVDDKTILNDISISLSMKKGEGKEEPICEIIKDPGKKVILHPRRNGPCVCGSGLKYKKCCKVKEKLQRYREKHGLIDVCVNKEDDDNSVQELAGGFRLMIM